MPLMTINKLIIITTIIIKSTWIILIITGEIQNCDYMSYMIVSYSSYLKKK